MGADHASTQCAACFLRSVYAQGGRFQCDRPSKCSAVGQSAKPTGRYVALCEGYTSNPKKTERRSAEDLNRLLSYTQSNDKTEHQLYVSGFNCIPQNAYEIMMETKQRWRKPVKDGNILAYHIIQSFSPGEATPDQVHQIGCEFAQRFLADRFECTVSTHLDRGHLHNHIVVNSVSYADGKMFRSDFNTYYKGIRETSDELCRENRLSVIETDGKGKSYDEWLSGQTGKPTIRGMVRKDVEQAICSTKQTATPARNMVRPSGAAPTD